MTDPAAANSANKFEVRYYFQLGRFAEWFATAENTVQDIIRHMTGLRIRDANALFSGVRSDQGCSYIRRLYEARGQDTPAELKAALDQFGVLTKLRNDILHFGLSREDDGSATITNRHRIHTNTRLRSRPISPELLEDAYNDLIVIFLVLSCYAAPETERHPMDDEAIQDAGRKAWRYIPLELASPRRTSPKTPARRKPPPDASQA